MIYSDEGTHIFSPAARGGQISVERFFEEQIPCKPSDRAPQAVAQTYDRSIVFDVTVATGIVS